MLKLLAILGVISTAIAAGLGYISIWWVLIPAFAAGSLSLSGGPGFEIVMQANREGRTSVMPIMLATRTAIYFVLAGTAYGITHLLA